MRFTVPGRIKGKGRPRATSRGGFVRMYTPAATQACEATVKHFAAEAMNGRQLLEGALWIEVTVYISPPQSWSQKKRATAVYVTGKPDCDNVLKLIGDALNGIVWKDDSQLSEETIRRRYTSGPEHVDIEIGRCGFNISAQPAPIVLEAA